MNSRPLRFPSRRRLEEQHEPTRHVHLRRRARAVAVLLTRSLEDELQGLRPLVVDTHGGGRPVHEHGRVAVTGLVCLKPAEAPAGTHVGLRADLVHELRVAAVGRTRGRAIRRDLASGEHEDRPDALADIAVYHDLEICDVGFDTGVATERAQRVAAGRGVLSRLPQTADPDRVPVLAGLLVVAEFSLNPRNGRELEGVAEEYAGLEDADAELCLPRLRAVGHLGIEVRIDIAIADSTQGCTAPLPNDDTDRAKAEQRHVVEDTLPTEEPQLTTGEDLRPILQADRQIHLAHVDLRARLRAGCR